MRRLRGLLVDQDSDSLGQWAAINAVKDATQSLDAARKAGAYEGTKYCIDKYGNSRIDWVVGPDAEQLTVSDGDVQFRGTCQRP